MTNSKLSTTVRLDETSMDKIKLIASKEKRSLNMQIEYAIESFIRDYEKVHGTIKL